MNKYNGMIFAHCGSEFCLRLADNKWSINLIKNGIEKTYTTLDYGLKGIMRNIADEHWKLVQWGRYTSCKDCYDRK